MIKQKTIFALTCILLLSMVTGYELYSGDTIEIELDKPYEYYSIVGNSSPIELTIQEDGNFINVTVGDYVSGAFELIFFDREKEVITVYTGGGGGGTRTKYVDRNITEYVDVEKIVYKNQTVDDNTEINYPDPIVKESKTYYYLFLGMVAVLILVIIYLCFMFRATKDFPQDDEPNNSNERRDEYE